MSKNEKSPAFTSPSLDAQPRAVTPRVISATAVVLLHAGLLVAFVSGVAPVQMLNVPSTPTLVFVPESPSAPLPQSRPPLPVTQPVMTLSRSESTFVADLPEMPLFQEEDSMEAGPVTNDEVRPATESSGLGPVPEGFAVLSRVNPTYPAAEKRAGHEGSVLLTVMVTPEGRVSSILVARSSGYMELDNAAISAVSLWQFTRSAQGSVQVTVPVTFRLQKTRF